MVTTWINVVNYMFGLLSNAYGVTSSGVLYTYNNQSPSQKVLLSLLPLRVGVDSNNWFVLA